MQTRDQERAAAAYARIESILNHYPNFKKKYGGVCLKMPAMIQQNGLCQAVSFYEAKMVDDKEEHADSNGRKLFLRDFAQVVLNQPHATAAELGRRARTAELSEYLRLSREALQCAVWFKRYAEAVLKVQPGEEDSQ